MNRRKLFPRRLPMLLPAAVIVLLFFSVCTVRAEEPQNRTVRIGYYPIAEYQEVKEDGTYSGFSYDYFVQIKKYTRWNYEFVEASYADCMEMLEKGEIDIMSGLNYTPEREKMFIFSQYSNSNSQNRIFAKADNQNLFYESYDTFDGCRIALMTGMRTDEIEEYSKNHHFELEPVFYNSVVEMEKALASGEVDLLLGSSVTNSSATKIVAKMKKTPLYYATTKGKPEIAEELDYALQKIIDNNPDFYTQLSEKYKLNGANATATFTREEMDYIRSNPKIYLVLNPDWVPVTWYDEKTDTYQGFALELLMDIEEYSGLHIEPCTEKDFYSMIEENPEIMNDVLSITADDTAWAERKNIVMTNHIMENSIVMISKIGKYMAGLTEDTVIALPKDYYISFMLDEEMKGRKVLYFDSIEECLNAVNDGKADVTYVSELGSGYYLSMMKYNNLYPSADSGYGENLAFGVNKDSTTPLLGILDKSLLCIGKDRISQIALRYSSAEEGFSMEGFYYSNPMVVWVIVLILCGMIVFVIYYRMKAANTIRQGIQERTLARFMGYVCAANESVLEVNLKDSTAQSYTQGEDGKVNITTFPYRQVHYVNYNDDIYPEDYDRVASNLSDEMLDEMIENEGGKLYFECRSRGVNGEYQWFAYSLQAIPKDDAHPRNFILFKKNIHNAKEEEELQKKTLQDALENARHASEAKSNFLSRVSHEIRTPLNAIIGYLALAKQSDSADEDMRRCIINSEIATKHLLNIINDVLDMSAIESGKMKFARDSFSLKELLESISAMFMNEAKKKGISFEIELCEFGQEWVVGDRLRVNQIIINLLSNAMKFTPENGKVSLVVTQMEKGEGSCRIKFEVKDTGIGISKEYRERLFKPFEQESVKTGQQFGGTGLGLSITWNLINMMGGSIDVRSEQGTGSTFTVLLSFECSEENEKQYQVPHDFSKVRAIIVDDEKADCAYIKELLKQCGVKSDIVTSGEKAIQRIKARKSTDYAYDLCIMDWQMPNQNGIETARRIRLECDDTMPIIVTTAYDVSAIREEATVAGVTTIIAKPLFQSTLFELLLHIFGAYEPKMDESLEKVDFNGVRVLLAEDNEMNRDIAEKVLKKSGFVVDVAVDGKMALDTFTASEEGTYQVILMDIQMPVMDGCESARLIRASQHPQAETIPIIAVSANAFSEDVAAAMACGMNAHVAKPIDYQKLYTVLKKYLVKEKNIS